MEVKIGDVNSKVVLTDVEQLEELLAVCKKCHAKNKITKKRKGAMMTFECVCTEGHKYTWRTSKCANGTPLVNTLTSAAIFCSGISFYAFERLASTIDMVFFSEKTYYNHINFYLSPVLQTKWFEMRKAQIDAIKNSPDEKLQVCGDGKFDSPGVNSAKYCIYTLMSVDGKVLDFVVFQKGLAPGEMEGKACHFVFQRLLDAVDGKIDLLCTDRSGVVTKLMRINFPQVKHAYDVMLKFIYIVI